MTGKLWAYKVVSKSMIPILCEGDLVFLKAVPYKYLKLGDIVGIKTEEKLYIHRIVSANKLENQYLLKGDNNPYTDGICLNTDNYVGKAVYVMKSMKLMAMDSIDEYSLEECIINNEKMYVCKVEGHKIIFSNSMCACL